jgi:eukaryotic-like serine/threonine-protein kinase
MSADRNLLFGILALQLDFIQRDDLIRGMHAWILEKAKSLGEVLIEQGALLPARRSLIESLLEEHLRVHKGDVHKSLAALTVPSNVRTKLMELSDEELQRSLAPTPSFAASGPATIDQASSRENSRYSILRSHARGGIGEVFIARDSELNRDVALKEIQPQRAGDFASRTRFVLEAEITAGLEHPGVVPIYGLGAHPDGRPYYAMRFIHGDSLLQAIRQFHANGDSTPHLPSEKEFALRGLLRRFVDVCNAVAYAHSRGVLHRDLKPGNVMLGKYGETLVVDWGLAKALGRTESTGEMATGGPLIPSSGSTSAPTALNAALGTIGYMSPEQAAGKLDELGAATDVYSLGATLYHLLVGQPSIRPTKNVEADLRLIINGNLVPPRQLKPSISPALEAICLKAMALAPGDRYKSALEVTDDIEHWLADEPVAAYPDPWTVRISRWARRHRTPLVGAAAFLLCAVAALSVTTVLVWQAEQKTAQQRQVAQANYEISRDQSFKIVALIESSEPEFAMLPALHDRRAELLQTASGACRQFLKQEPDDFELVQRSAQIYRFSANFNRFINETTQAEPLYQDSIELRKRLIAQFPADASQRFNLGEVERDYAHLKAKQGRLSAAADGFQESLQIAERLIKEADEPAYRRSAALALLNLAEVEYRRGGHQKSDTAEKSIHRSVASFRALLAGPEQGRHVYDPLFLASALNIEAMIDRDTAKLDAAAAAHKEAINLLKEMLDKKPKGVNLADVVYFLAHCQVEQCKTWPKTPQYAKLAEANMGFAINKFLELANEYKKIPTYQESAGATFQERGQLLLQSKNFKKAREHFKRAQEILSPLVQKNGDLPGPRGELGKALCGLGQTALLAKDEPAGPFLAQAAAELRSALARAPEDAELKRSLDNLAKLTP